MPATAENIVARPDGITRVDLAALVALRGRAMKPHGGRAPLRTAAAGAHVTSVRGRGMDYAESRVYQAGDDARHIDWRRTARSGRWFTKLYEVERGRNVVLLLDTHASMRFGTRARYKSVAAARAASWLAWSCVRAGDRIGALAFGVVRGAVDPQPGPRGALAVAGALARWDADAAVAADASGIPLTSALAGARRMLRPGDQAWLLSDGWCIDAAAADALARLAHRADLRVVIVADALERIPPPAGAYTFETDSTSARVELSGDVARNAFRDRLAHGWQALAEACRAAAAPSAVVATTDEPDNVAMAALWRRRAGCVRA